MEERREDNESRPDDGREFNIEYESEEELGSVQALRAKLSKAKAELEESKKAAKEYLDGWQRCKADAVNAKRETLQQAERTIGAVKEMFVAEELIPILDSFDAALGGAAWETLDDTWKTGVMHIQNQLLNVLSRHGVERYGKAGDMFNHVFHEVVEETGEAAGEPGTIVRVLRFGYKSGEKILRPAHVIVKSHPRGESKTL